VLLVHLLTLAVAPDLPPVTTSLRQNVPIPVVAAAPIVIVGVVVYPSPGLIT